MRPHKHWVIFLLDSGLPESVTLPLGHTTARWARTGEFEAHGDMDLAPTNVARIGKHTPTHETWAVRGAQIDPSKRGAEFVLAQRPMRPTFRGPLCVSRKTMAPPWSACSARVTRSARYASGTARYASVITPNGVMHSAVRAPHATRGAQ